MKVITDNSLENGERKRTGFQGNSEDLLLIFYSWFLKVI